MRVFLQDLLEPHFLTATFFANFLMRRPGHGCLTNFFAVKVMTLTDWTCLQLSLILLIQVVVLPFFEQEILALMEQAFFKQLFLHVANLFLYCLDPTVAPVLA